MTSLVSYEPFVDNVNEELCEVLAEKARAQERLPILRWMQLYAFDVIGHITVCIIFIHLYPVLSCKLSGRTTLWIPAQRRRR